jgi:hypothetical protein
LPLKCLIDRSVATFKDLNFIFSESISVPSSLSPVHYIGRLADSGSIFMDTKEAGTSGQPVTVVAGRGKQ